MHVAPSADAAGPSASTSTVTLPLFLALHLVYGTLVGRVMFPRMRAEGEVLGPPLLIMLLPVALVTAPIAAVFVRYSSGWFLHGALTGEGNVLYERFHMGLLLAVIILAGVFTCAGVVNVAVWASRDRPRLARAGLWVAVAALVLTAALDLDGLITIKGTGGRHLWSHPVGLLSLAAVVVLGAWVAVCKARFAGVPEVQQVPGMGVPKSVAGPLV